MPVYEYRCASCEHEWEEMASITSPATQFCPQCKARTAQRLISKTSFRLKDGAAGSWADKGYASKEKKL